MRDVYQARSEFPVSGDRIQGELPIVGAILPGRSEKERRGPNNEKVLTQVVGIMHLRLDSNARNGTELHSHIPKAEPSIYAAQEFELLE